LYPIAMRFFIKNTYASDPQERDSPLEHWELRLAATDEEHRPWLGAEIVEIGGIPMVEAVKKIAEYLPIESGVKEGNACGLFDHAVRTEIMDYFMNPWLMRALDLADSEGISLTLSVDGQKQEHIRFEEVTQETFSWIRVLDSIPSVAFSRSHPGESWWAAEVPSQNPRILYFRYDQCASDAWPVMQEILDKLDNGQKPEGNIDFLIIDLRYNAGGNSMPGTRFAHELSKKPIARKPGGVMLLISGATFSSAMMNCADILKACGGKEDLPGNAILIGEPLIEPLEHYGEVHRFLLPESGITVSRSSRRWNYAAMSGIRTARGMLEPSAEHLVYPRFDAYRSGQDPAFEHALALANKN
ncbi:MAG: hypothetical protein N3A02_08195, partial [Rectinema sp.]|nr:hypothetical protein [Rectinema sp.]